MPNGCRLNPHFNLKKMGSWTFCRPQNSASFRHPKTIKVSKTFYFFRRSRKFSKKGLGESMCTHMAHLKNFDCRFTGEKQWNFGFRPNTQKCACRVQILAPSPFWINMMVFHARGSFFWSLKSITKKSYFGHIWVQMAPNGVSVEIFTLILGAVVMCLMPAYTLYGEGAFTRYI